jgi:hypothetical protein
MGVHIAAITPVTQFVVLNPSKPILIQDVRLRHTQGSLDTLMRSLARKQCLCIPANTVDVGRDALFKALMVASVKVLTDLFSLGYCNAAVR